MSRPVVTRFAPSPTGLLHAGALIVTHSRHIAECCDRILELSPEGLR